jgi:uncharacterized protein YbaP (TraB family)
MSSCSGKQEQAASLLWKITTPDGKESYLFGTIHVYPQDRITISARAIEALRSCQVLVIERNVRDEEDQRLFIQHNRYKLGQRTYQVMNSTYGGRLKNMEAELMRVADEHRIRITGLETAGEVLEVLDKVSVPLDDLPEEQIHAQAEQLISLYNSGQADFLADSVLNRELGPETRKLLVDQRNLNWLDDIERLIQPGGAFIAVGMGHLGGENGLVHLLRQRGYLVENLKP